MVEMVPVNSENIDFIGFDKVNKSLHIKFENDTTEYMYRDIKLETFIEILFSQSKHKYLEENIFNCFEKIAV